jgi:hypothetical protein
MRAALARMDEVLKQYEYKPELKFDKGTPQARVQAFGWAQTAWAQRAWRGVACAG